MNDRTITVGRAPDCNISIDPQWDSVSNNHADLSLRGGALFFRDHSTNGTLINGQNLHNAEMHLTPGDTILLAGTYQLTWEVLCNYFPEVMNTPAPASFARPPEEKTSVMPGRMVGGEVEPPSAQRMTEQFSASQAPNINQTQTMAAGQPQTLTAEQPQPQIQPKEAPQQQTNDYGRTNEFSFAEMDRRIGQWNWGAFLCSWIWAVRYGKLWTLPIVIVGLIPYLGQVCETALGIYLGMNGSRLAWKSGKHADFSSYVKAQRIWTFVGIPVFLFRVAFMLCALYFILSLI